MPPNKRTESQGPVSDEPILHVDDPRPQVVPQYPSAPRRRPPRRAEDARPPGESASGPDDEELQAQYGTSGDADSLPAFLYVERGPGAGQLLQLNQGTVVLGRASVSDLRLQHPSISRRHAQIKRQAHQFFVKDLGSQNGTFVNKRRIASEIEVKPGDAIALGNALLRLRGPLEQDKASSKADRARIATDLIPRQIIPRVSGSAMKIAVFAGALGFGLAAVLAFVLVKTMSPKPDASAIVTAPALPAQNAAREKILDEAIQKKMAEQSAMQAQPALPAAATKPVTAAVESPKSTPSPAQAPAPTHPKVKSHKERSRAAPARAARSAAPAPPAKTAAARAESKAELKSEPARPEAAAKAVAVDPPKDTAQVKRTQLLAAYERGNAEGSLTAAQNTNDKELVDRLSRFIAVYDAANDAMLANNSNTAITNFQRALQLDEQLSSGWGKYGGEIRRQLGNLYVLVGIKYQSGGDRVKAKSAFESSLKHDPNNARAKEQIEKMDSAPIDKAFEAPQQPSSAPSARRPVTPKAAAIDEAFGE